MPIMSEAEIAESVSLQRSLLVNSLRASERPRLPVLADYVIKDDGPIPLEIRQAISRALLAAERASRRKKRLGLSLEQMLERRWAVRSVNVEYRNRAQARTRDPLGSALRYVASKFAVSSDSMKRWRDRRQVTKSSKS